MSKANAKNVRGSVIKILEKLEQDHSFSNELLLKEEAQFDDRRDINLMRHIVMGTLKNQILLDYLIENYSKRPVKKIDPMVLQVLRMSSFQLLFMDIGDHAVIYEGVELVKRKKRFLGGFTNGVLRTIVRSRSDILLEIERLEPSIRYSLPKDIYEYLEDSFGKEKTISICKAMNEKIPLTMRIKKSEDIEKVLDRLNDRGFEAVRSPLVENGIIIGKPFHVESLPEYENGILSIQGIGSILSVNSLNANKDSTVLDVCAAPGTKSIQIAQDAEPKKLVLNDINTHKNIKVKKAFQRIKDENFELTNQDAASKMIFSEPEFDYVLVDAPCSALGLIGRKPEIKLRRTIEDIQNFASIQLLILKEALKHLKTGGTLVYSTCTMGQVENQGVIKQLLMEYPNMHRVPLWFQNRWVEEIELTPDAYAVDGFYICKLKKEQI